MPNQSVEARLASLAEASVELDTVWREILRPGAGEPDEELVRRHEQALRLVLDADQEHREVTGLRRGTD
jgi:hypothetical protein